jgi:chromosomal replication initiation ATPase DnaA
MSGFSFIEALRQTAIIPPTRRFVSMRQICRDVMKRHGLTHAEFYDGGREWRYSHARHEAFAVAHTLGKSLPQIGEHFGFDHTTVLHGIRAHRARQGGTE